MDPKGSVCVTELDNGKKLIEVEPGEGVFIPVKSCQTDYPLSLIESILAVKNADYLCDEICRDIDPTYVQSDLEQDLSAYFSFEELNHKRILDFGCGSGASTMILSRLFPDATVVGVELEEKHLQIARKRLEHYGSRNVSFFLSPSGSELPEDIGTFDLIVLSAVYEHLLPNERKNVIPLVWSKLDDGGCIFLNMTPHRWFPIEHHTTGLPLINYLPPRPALVCARTFSKRIDKGSSWETLLRQGIRGATKHEIVKLLSRESDVVLLEPLRHGLNDRIDLWFSQLGKDRYLALKRSIWLGLKAFRAATGITLVPNLSLAIKKAGPLNASRTSPDLGLPQ